MQQMHQLEQRQSEQYDLLDEVDGTLAKQRESLERGIATMDNRFASAEVEADVETKRVTEMERFTDMEGRLKDEKEKTQDMTRQLKEIHDTVEEWRPYMADWGKWKQCYP